MTPESLLARRWGPALGTTCNETPKRLQAGWVSESDCCMTQNLFFELPLKHVTPKMYVKIWCLETDVPIYSYQIWLLNGWGSMLNFRGVYLYTP